MFKDVTNGRICISCGVFTDIDGFYRNTKKKVGKCKKCYRAYSSRYNRDLRILALVRYSSSTPSCACCGEKHLEFLAIDHINGGGNTHRRSITKAKHWQAANIYSWLKQNNYPAGFRVLCHNCNLSLGFYKYCPHNLNTP